MKKDFGKYIAAMVVYAGFAIYLYRPHLRDFSRLQYLVLVSVLLGSVGSFVLSRRWVSTFAGSLMAGGVYGFGPFVLGLGRFHPTAGLLAASIPWLFCPAAFGPRQKWRWLSWPLSALPFLAVPVFCETAAYFRLFAIPLNTRLTPADLMNFFVPVIAAERGAVLIGFYHVPLAALVIGFSMLIVARRFGILAILILGVIPAFCNPVFNTSPIIWFSIATLVGSILVGEGVQGLTLAGGADRKLLLAVAVIMALLSLIALLPTAESSNTFAGYVKLSAATTTLYMLGAIAVAIIYFIVRAGLRLQWLRLGLICFAMAIDIFLSARFIVDRIF